MSEDNTDQPISTSEADKAVVPDTTDWFLQAIIGSYANAGVQIGITLTVGGSVVSGVLISGRTYFEELQKTLSLHSKEDGDMFAIMAEDFGSIGPEMYDKPEDAPEDWKLATPTYIHLMSARFHAPGHDGIPLKDGFLWRGKISSIDAFSIGNFSSGDAAKDD